MVRPKRVLSFMSEWGGGGSSSQHRKTPSSAGASPLSPTAKQALASTTFSRSSTALENYEWSSPSPTARPNAESRPSSRPMSMIQTYQPPVMEVGQDTLPELQRIFMFLNSHSNKLYQEGYFLKFHDTDTRGRPAPDRIWQECFAQLVGTILSLWDASELDDASGDAEVLPTFINLTDAAIHMMPSMTLSDGKKLDNVLSVSTAASNKYLFHFNSFNSLTQWTAGIRLAMYEHTSLQEAYTGALIAGKGKALNNIRVLLDRQRAKYEDWARVRFGAGTPWRRCWCVVTPPDEKELQKLQKLQKKQKIYNRGPIILKGDMKFYETKKVTKRTKPIATVKDAYSCYAIYPQSKPLIEQSTLVKIEGKITIHSKPEVTTEGFVFVMPEARPMLSGFEIMLQFLFPVFDTFNLYGRPTKLIADVLDARGLMFAMPADRRYGYLEMWDVVSLIHSEGSQAWSERQWRKELKDLTSKRMTAGEGGGSMRSRRNTIGRNGFPGTRSMLRFDESSIRSSPSTRQSSPSRNTDFDSQGPRRVDSAPPTGSAFSTPRHQRSVSEQQGYSRYHAAPSRLAYAESLQEEEAPTPPPHAQTTGTPQNGTPQPTDTSDTDEAVSPDARNLPELPLAPSAPPKGPVEPPPTFAHAPSQKPPVQPYLPPTMRPSPQVDPATLHQMADATNTPLPAGVAAAGAAAAWKSQESLNGRRSGEYDTRGQEGYMNANLRHSPADRQSASRLPTIPASPYVEPPEFVPSPVTYQPEAPPVPEHSEQPQTRPSQESARHTRPGSNSSQIHRKPVPGRSSFSSHGDDSRSIASSRLDSLRNDVIDPSALDSLSYIDAGMLRQNSQSSSRYSDDVSTSSPDYASTASEEIQPRRLPVRREDRPRSGMLKTIGDPSLTPKPDVVLGDVHYKPNAKPVEVSADLPTIDFGPTYALSMDPNASAKRPGTSGTMTQALHDNSFSRSKENLASSSPNERDRQSTYMSGRTTPIATMHMRSPSGSPSFSDSRSVAWQPGMAAQPPQQHADRQKLDPEEWVAQRAAAANQPRVSPVYGHGRSMSHTPPPVGRAKSGDWSHLQQQTQRTSADPMPARPPSRPLSRPHSRGASTLLVDQRPVALSAREQEQVARMTNTPLIDLTRSKAKEQKPSEDGLTGYISYREKEKAAAKANRNTLAMQAEADRRIMATQQRQMMEMQQQQMELQQQQMLEMQQQQMGMAQGAYTPSIYGTPQGYPQSFGYGTPTPNQMFQQQAGYFPPAGVPGNMQQTMQQQWNAPSPQLQGPFMAQQNMSMGNLSQQQLQQQQQQQRTQPYGASFDQAQAAARYAHQQGQHHRRG